MQARADAGIGYSPQEEREFVETCRKMEKHAENHGIVEKKQAEAAIQTYSDASFGVTYKTMRSVSGVVVVLRLSDCVEKQGSNGIH